MYVGILRWEPYKIPFTRGFHTAHGEIPQREGAILFLHTTDGRIGIGEVAPLPAWGGSLHNSLRLLAQWAPLVVGVAVDESLRAFEQFADHQGIGGPDRAAVASGIDLAACDLLGQASGQRIAALLAPGRIPAPSVPVNATVGAATTADAVREAHEAVQAGFGCIKLKVGLGNNVQLERERVKAVRDAIGDRIELRLDANGGWTVAEAVASMTAFAPFHIRLIEQPVATVQELAAVRRRCPAIPVAADEAVTGIAATEEIIRQGAADVLIVKPMAVGGVRAAARIIRVAEEAGLMVLVTSMLESGVGLCGVAHVAAILEGSIPACGLATGALLADDLLVQSLSLQGGTLVLPDRSGLGVDVDPDKLTLYKFE